MYICIYILNVYVYTAAAAAAAAAAASICRAGSQYVGGAELSQVFLWISVYTHMCVGVCVGVCVIALCLRCRAWSGHGTETCACVDVVSHL